jgi:hypothetical protein
MRLEQTVVPPLRALALSALSEAVRAVDASDDAHERTMQPLRSACARAREAGLHAEDLIVILKDVWRELPDVQKMERAESNNTLAHIVSSCIEEFYTGEHPAAQ